ncbi:MULTISPECIES: hypothetical protein [Pseudomonas]|uniref:Uncharacterized protein n=1 Tax=Pseudomonas putida TaxID=303 RepID=A0A1L7N5W9_PSEPU|nr:MULTISPECIES: hypothetical protein [Pseudomonas]MBP2085697.1 hypothetical protein [Pseudomonas sp. PvP089]MBP2088601.1 hypothetical protein [Pseudomonas sp. PvP088]MBP2225079.1 hypothetical protein [Pseudomonas putida]MCE0890593.1 hypothetical protein [Pseudomonas alloputida]MCE0919855.1 hypothetical protein [Pseudomonas alloputida]
MSLETEIAGLSSKVTSLIDYFTTAKTAIAKAIADAVAAAPAISRTFYVNQLIGDDNALGNSDSPLKTIGRAVVATPSGGVADIILVEDYTHTEFVSVGSRRIMIRGETEGSTTRKLILNEYLGANGMKRFGGFQFNRASSVDFADMTISLPDSAGGLQAAQDTYYSMIYAGGSKAPGFMPVKLYNVAFALRGTFTGKIVGAGFPCVSLSAINCTIPAALEGSLLNGVAAGKDPNTIPWLTTNIVKL